MIDSLKRNWMHIAVIDAWCLVSTTYCIVGNYTFQEFATLLFLDVGVFLSVVFPIPFLICAILAVSGIVYSYQLTHDEIVLILNCIAFFSLLLSGLSYAIKNETWKLLGE